MNELKPAIKTCNVCNQIKPYDSFPPKRGKCKDCFRIAKKDYLIKNFDRIAKTKSCACCGKEFKTLCKPRKDGYKSGVYCSNRCKSNAELKTRVNKACEYCGNSFWHWPSHNERFCSHACSSESIRTSVSVDCASCGKAFDKRQSAIKRTSLNFCSSGCVYQYRVGIKHPNYVHGKGGKRGNKWRYIRKEILKRDNYTCQRCRTHRDDLTKKQWRLEVHHIIPYGLFQSDESANSEKNLITYCHTCHWIEERKSKMTKKTLLYNKQMVLFA